MCVCACVCVCMGCVCMCGLVLVSVSCYIGLLYWRINVLINMLSSINMQFSSQHGHHTIYGSHFTELLFIYLSNIPENYPRQIVEPWLLSILGATKLCRPASLSSSSSSFYSPRGTGKQHMHSEQYWQDNKAAYCTNCCPSKNES